MSIEAELRKIIKADGPVAGLIVARMYPLVVPQNADKPYIAYARISTQRTRVMSGYSGPTVVAFRLTCWSLNYDTSVDLANKVRAVIDNAKGTWGDITIQRCFVTDESDELNPPPGLFEQNAFGRNLDIEMVYVE